MVWEFEVSGFRVLPEWWRPRLHWTPTVSEAKQAMQVVSAIRRFIDLARQLDRVLSAALISSQPLVTPSASAPLDVADVGIGNEEEELATAASEERRAPTITHLLDELDLEQAPASGLVPLSRATLEIPWAEVEVDFDIEFDEQQQVYLWGMLVTDRRGGDSTYRHLGNPQSDFDEDALAQLLKEQFTKIVESASDRGRSVHFFHYGSTDRQHLDRLLGADALPFTSRMSDLLSIVRQLHKSSVGYSLKELAAEAGFLWRSEGMTGEDTFDLIAAARAGDRDAWDKRLRYNEDDTRATKALRDHLVMQEN